MGDGDRDRGARDEVEAADFGTHFNDWLRESAIRVVRIELRCDEAALVAMAERDDRARSS
jgi:hypothetical protein